MMSVFAPSALTVDHRTGERTVAIGSRPAPARRSSALLRSTALALCLVTLSGCETIGEAYDDVAGFFDDSDETAPPATGTTNQATAPDQTRGFPNLATVPARPDGTPQERRQALQQGLAAPAPAQGQAQGQTQQGYSQEPLRAGPLEGIQPLFGQPEPQLPQRSATPPQQAPRPVTSTPLPPPPAIGSQPGAPADSFGYPPPIDRSATGPVQPAPVTPPYQPVFSAPAATPAFPTAPVAQAVPPAPAQPSAPAALPIAPGYPPAGMPPQQAYVPVAPPQYQLPYATQPLLARRGPAPAAMTMSPMPVQNPYMPGTTYAAGPAYGAYAAQPAFAAGPSFGAGQPIAEIIFGYGKANLDPEDRSVLRQAAAFIQQQGAFVNVVGHASHRSGAKSERDRELGNFRISIARADTVARELIALGIPAEGIQVDAVSDSIPQFAETAPTGVTGNQRVVIYIRR